MTLVSSKGISGNSSSSREEIQLKRWREEENQQGQVRGSNRVGEGVMAMAVWGAGVAAGGAGAWLYSIRPRDPVFEVVAINLAGFNLRFCTDSPMLMAVVDVELTLSIRVTNGNITPIEYTSTIMDIYYRGTLLGQAQVTSISVASLLSMLKADNKERFVAGLLSGKLLGSIVEPVMPRNHLRDNLLKQERVGVKVKEGDQAGKSSKVIEVPCKLDGLEMTNHVKDLFSDVTRRQMNLHSEVTIAGHAKVWKWTHNFEVHVTSEITVDPIFLNVIGQENKVEMELESPI